MISGRWLPEGTPPEEVMALWRDVFHWDESRRRRFSERDAAARAACLYAEDGTLAAAGRMYYEDGAFWLDALAVREDLRGQGFGDLLSRMMLDRAVRCAAREVRLYSAAGCAGFFERYGFRFAGGDDALMVVEAGAVRLGGSCGV